MFSRFVKVTSSPSWFFWRFSLFTVHHIDQILPLHYNWNMIKVVSKALIKNKNGKYLLLYRGDTHPNFPGHLDLPGGEVESEETSKTATAREVQEETGICIYPNDLKKLFVRQHKNTRHILFEIVIDKTEADISVKLSWEHKKYRWMTLSELLDTNIPEGTDPYYIDVIDYLKHLSEAWSVRHISPYYAQTSHALLWLRKSSQHSYCPYSKPYDILLISSSEIYACKIVFRSTLWRKFISSILSRSTHSGVPLV